jgi:hypothetical protein
VHCDLHSAVCPKGSVNDGLVDQSVALLGQYMASSLATVGDGSSGTAITDLMPNQHPYLSLPHAA